jgi:O-antigen/teichoic acid export membrane protein
MSSMPDNLDCQVAAQPSILNYAPRDRVRGTAARGFAWMIVQAVGSKLASIASQLILAWFLTRNDFGLTGLALSVSILFNVLQEAGLKEAVLKRTASLESWLVPAFWMSLLAGLIAALLIAGAAPLAALVFNDTRLVPLILILSIAPILNGLALVPQVKLQVERQFGHLAFVYLSSNLSQIVLSIVLAILGFGAYSVIVPLPIVAAVRAAGFWYFAPLRIPMRLDLARWTELLRDGFVITCAVLMATLQSQGDYIILGSMHDKATVGIYYFAFSLSVQTAVLISQNLSYVALPTLASMQANPERQNWAFLEAARVVALVGIPIALLQAAAAGPVIRLFFAPRWHDAIVVFQVLSVGMAFRLMGGLATNFLQARGRFSTHLYIAIAYTVVFLTVVAIAARSGGALSVALEWRLCLRCLSRSRCGQESVRSTIRFAAWPRFISSP